MVLRPLEHDSPWKITWNLVILATVLVFTFLITYRLVFHNFRADGLYYSLNLLLLIDIGVNFMTKVKDGHVRQETFPMIRRHYLKSWFAVDFLSFFPFELVILLIFGTVPTEPTWFGLYLGLQGLTLIKLLKGVRLFREIQMAFGFSPAVLRLVSFVYWFLQAIHIMALGWILIGAGEPHRIHYDQYLRALYWVTTTVATIGYGDYFPNHDSNLQILYTIIIQLFGVSMYTFIIANVSSLVSNLDFARAAYQQKLGEVNAYLRGQRVPPHLQERVRDYYSYLFTEKKSIDSRSVIEDLPMSLSLEILMHQNRELLERVEVFQGADEVFIREAVIRLKPRIFLPQEHIIHQGEVGDSMYFLTVGELSVQVGTAEVARLGPGSIFGEAALITEERRNASVVALSYGSGYQLAKADFEELCHRYPEFDQRVQAIAAKRHSRK